MRAPLFLLLFYSTSAQAESVSIGSYAFWNRGTARSISLAGATVAEGQASSGAFENPAALGFQKGWLTGTLGWGNPNDQGFTPGHTTPLRQGYRVLGASVSLWDRLAFGVGLEELSFRSENSDDLARRFSFRDEVSGIGFSSALRIGSWLSLGATLINQDSWRQLSLSLPQSPVQKAESRASGETWKAGVVLRPFSSVSLGVTYRESARFSLAHSASRAEPLFRESFEPRLVQAALSWHPWSKERSSTFFTLQCDFISFPQLPSEGHLYYAPAAIFGAQAGFELQTRNAIIPRAAFEFPLWHSTLFSFVTRSGSYYEPSYIKGRPGRWHGTAGVVMRFWYVALQGAIDAAKNYQNWNYGLGLDFDV